MIGKLQNIIDDFSNLKQTPSKVNIEEFIKKYPLRKKTSVCALLIKLIFKSQIRFKGGEMTYFG